MGVLTKIAYRNLREHKTKTVIIGAIIAIAMTVLVIGNSVLDTATAGIKANYTENYTGNIIVAADTVEAPALTPDNPANRQDEPTPTIPDYTGTRAVLESYPGIAAVNPIVTGMAMTQIDGEGFGFMQFYGVEPATYRAFFPNNLEIVDGSFLQDGQEGLVISERTLDMLRESAAREIGVGDSILLTSQSKIYGMKIRELPIVGVFSFKNAALPLEFISFIDVENARILNGMTGITDLQASLTEQERSILGTVDEESLFGGGGLISGPVVSETPASGNPPSVRDFDSVLGDTSVRAAVSTIDPNAWHYLLVRLDNDGAADRTVRNLNRSFADTGAGVKAFPWIDGAGAMAQFTYGLKTVFNVLVIVVAIVAVIIIMNTLVISVTERIPEIGTMRAIGAQKRFVRQMILLETLMISVAFGALGILFGSGITAILGAVGLESDNVMLQVFMGGPVLNPVVSVPSVVASLVAVISAGLLSSLYPAAVALRIQPVTAMNTN